VVTTKIALNGEKDFIAMLKDIVSSARSQAYSAINFAQVKANWLIGKRLVEQEQHGKERAEYGKYVIQLASAALTEEYGYGFSIANLKNFRRFYLLFRDFQIGQTVPDQLETALTQPMDTEIGQATPSQFRQNTFQQTMTRREDRGCYDVS
jgi:hypothetical protein